MQKVALTFLVMLLAPSKFAINTSCLCNPLIFLGRNISFQAQCWLNNVYPSISHSHSPPKKLCWLTVLLCSQFWLDWTQHLCKKACTGFFYKPVRSCWCPCFTIPNIHLRIRWIKHYRSLFLLQEFGDPWPRLTTAILENWKQRGTSMQGVGNYNQSEGGMACKVKFPKLNENRDHFRLSTIISLITKTFIQQQKIQWNI